MASETVLARWVHPNEHTLTDGTLLVPGETVVEIPEAELASSHWEKATKAQAAKAEGGD